MIPVTKELNRGFSAWIDMLSSKWSIYQEETALYLGEGEVKNRLEYYPRLATTIRATTFELQPFSEAARACWALGGRFLQVRMNAFLKNQDVADAIQRLVSDFPVPDDAATKRINSFIEFSTDAGFEDPTGGKDRSGAALLTSVILTAIFPERFVDYRQSRWQKLAQQVGCARPPNFKDYGSKLLWAGALARALGETDTFQKYWPEGQASWVLAGLSWSDPKQSQPNTLITSLAGSLSVPEGAQKQRLHLVRERNQTLVRAAKEAALQKDGRLRCEVCQFCFTNVYGKHGDGFIEAHHRTPISELKQETRTRVGDLALLCANCHRMIHRGEKTLSVPELRRIIG